MALILYLNESQLNLMFSQLIRIYHKPLDRNETANHQLKYNHLDTMGH